MGSSNLGLDVAFAQGMKIVCGTDFSQRADEAPDVAAAIIDDRAGELMWTV